jgi:hypothetical protein
VVSFKIRPFYPRSKSLWYPSDRRLGGSEIRCGRKIDIRFGTWNLRSLYRAGSLKTAAGELAKCKFDLLAVQEVRWVENGSQPAHDFTFFMEMEMMKSRRDRFFSYVRE